MERGKHTVMQVNRLGIVKSEMEGVGARRVVHRVTVGRGGWEEDVQSLQDALSSSAGTSLAFETLVA